jgi:hypothetical protein
MNSRLKKCAPLLAIATMLFAVGISARAQDKAHVVSLADLNKDSAQAAQTRPRTKTPFALCFLPNRGKKP